MAAPDVVIVGAGPAGAIAGLVLARAGARVCLMDRAMFPRDKLCGDTVNPGTLAVLERLGVGREIEAQGLRVDGMILTGGGGIAVEGRYEPGVHGRAIVRRDLDSILLRHAIGAGCSFEPNLRVTGAIVEERGARRIVRGVIAGSNGSTRRFPSAVVIAADGRRSTLAFGLGLARHPRTPRRWAIGAYFDVNAATGAVVGEMHVRPGCYIGVAPVPGGLTNVCLVTPSRGGDAELRDPAAALRRALMRYPELRERFGWARPVAPPTVLGPLAVDVTRESIAGLLLAGDAAGFIDPMTGDGLRFAVRGGELAGRAALRALEGGWRGLHHDLEAARAREFSGKERFNRVLRAVVSSPRSIAAAAIGARIAPGAFRAMIAHAGDTAIATRR